MLLLLVSFLYFNCFYFCLAGPVDWIMKQLEDEVASGDGHLHLSNL